MARQQSLRVGPLLREWRRHRRLSQLDLALHADTSARHLSCVETGRARPSRAMVLHLATAMDVPLRERNALLLAADYAPAYRESGLDDHDMASARSTLETMLTTHEPCPAVVVDRYWNVLPSNQGMSVFMQDIPAHLLGSQPNVFRLVLHPDGLASRLNNLSEVRGSLLERLLRQVNTTGDTELRTLYDEMCQYSSPAGDQGTAPSAPESPPDPIQVPLRVRAPRGELSMFSTMATFGAPADVTLSELAIEMFYPLDEFTTNALRGWDPHAG